MIKCRADPRQARVASTRISPAGGDRVPEFEHRFLVDEREPPRTKVEDYRRAGGYVALQQAVSSMTRAQVIGEVRTAGLRGRGGAGVLTAEKLSLVAQTPDEPKYLGCNAYDADP